MGCWEDFKEVVGGGGTGCFTIRSPFSFRMLTLAAAVAI